MPTRETRNRVLLAFVRGLSVKDAATVIGISVPTLRQHYSAELEKRTTAALRMEMRQLERLNQQAEAGNVAAEKELARQLDKMRTAQLSDHVVARGKAKKPKPKGKKEEQQDAAQGVGGRFGTRQPPPALIQ